MRAVLQRVTRAAVAIDGRDVARIGTGLLILLGVAAGDTEADAAQLAEKIAKLRIFSDAQGKMNLNVSQAGGAVLSVSQFTLCADTRSGNRPGFDGAAPPETARALWNTFNQHLAGKGIPLSTGVFGAQMEVSLVNDGPVTIWLDTRTSAPSSHDDTGAAPSA